mgnify:CR=1 FL=1
MPLHLRRQCKWLLLFGQVFTLTCNLIYLAALKLLLNRIYKKLLLIFAPIDGTAIKGTPTAFSFVDDASIRFYPTPDAKLTFNGVVVLKPKLSATGVEGFIFDAHSRAIASGTIAKLAEIPGKEWSNPDLAMQHRVMYERCINKAKGRDTRRVNLRVASIGFAD